MLQGISSYAVSPLLTRPTAAAEPTAQSAQETPDKQVANTLELDEQEQREVERLKARDREVRAHEMAHLAAAGSLATSGASFTYERGPDGVSYAVGGEVGIDTSPGRTPEETLQRARIIRAAAMAPAEPSGQDRAVAAKAAQMESQARAEMVQQDSDEPESNDSAKPGQRNPLTGYAQSEPAQQPGSQLDIHA